MKLLAVGCFLLCTVGCSDSSHFFAFKNEQAEAFDLFCEVFSEIAGREDYKALDPSARNEALLKKLDDRIEVESDVRVAWTAVNYAPAEERYGLFKESAQSVGHPDWQCEAMRLHAHEFR